MAQKKPWCGKRLTDQTRTIVMNVHEYFRRLNTHKKESYLDYKVAAATGISVRTIQRIKKEFDEGTAKPPPPRVRPEIVVGKLDAFDMECVRRELLLFYVRGEIPTVLNLLEKVRNPPVNFVGCKSSLYKIVKKLGFCSRLVHGGRRALIETREVVTARNRYLNTISENRSSTKPRPEVYIDENYIDQDICWRQCCAVGNGPVGSNLRIGKEARVVIVLAGGEDGFVPGTSMLLRLKSVNKGDRHSSMNYEIFRSWFQNLLLPNIPDSALIVMDDAFYHSDCKKPTSGSEKCDIMEWLMNNNVKHDSTQSKSELLELVELHKDTKVYGVDHMAQDRGHKILRLPPHHNHFNPLELVWTRLKSEVKKNLSNADHSQQRVEDLVKVAIKGISSEDWREYVHQIKQMEEKYRTMDVAVEQSLKNCLKTDL